MMTSASFSHMATVTASVKRPPVVSGGKRGTPVAHIASLKCFPLDPLTDAEIVNQLNLMTPQEVLQTYVQDGLDIVEGDVLVVSGVDYQIRAVEDWDWPPNDTFLRLTLTEIKTRPAP